MQYEVGRLADGYKTAIRCDSQYMMLDRSGRN